MRSLSIIGLGRAGGSLTLALRGHFDIGTLVYRDATPTVLGKVFEPDHFVAWHDLSSIGSEILIIATPDQEIRRTAETVAALADLPRVALHLSGSLASDELSALRVRGVSIGSMHPLLSLSDPERGAASFVGSYFCLEGDELALRSANEIVGALQGNSFTIETNLKPLYHASAVMASGHLTALLDSAFEMLSKCGMSWNEARKILFPLIDSTIANLREQPAERALTGPFARGDKDAFDRHMASFDGHLDPAIREIYLTLAARSLELARRGGIGEGTFDDFMRAISMAKDNLE